MTDFRQVETPDWRALPTRWAEAQARLAGVRRAAVSVALGVAVLVALWAGAIRIFDVPAFVAPGPGATLASFAENRGQLFAALGHTLTGAGIGLVIATVLALALATGFTLSRVMSRALMPLVIGIRTVPVLAVAPLLILIFGRGQGATIVTVVIVGFFPIMVNAMRGFRSVPSNVDELFHVAGARWWQLLWKARIPFALPYIFTGLRTAATSALLSAMLAEWLSGSPGIGRLIYDAYSYRDMPLMFAAVALSMATAYALFAATSRLERSLTE